MSRKQHQLFQLEDAGSSEEDNLSPRDPTEAPPPKPNFNSIYDAAFYNPELCGENEEARIEHRLLSERVYHALISISKKLASALTNFETCWKEILKDQDLIKELKTFFAFWPQANGAHRKIALLLSTQDFIHRFIASVEVDPSTYFSKGLLERGRPILVDYTVHNHLMKMGLINIMSAFLPTVQYSIPVRGASVIELKVDLPKPNRALVGFFKLGAHRASIDAALSAFANVIRKPDIFAETIVLRLMPADFLRAVKLDFGSVERFCVGNKIVIKHRMISAKDLLANQKRPRHEQAYLIGSFQPEYVSRSPRPYIIPNDDLLILVSWALVFHLRDIKIDEDMVDETIIDAETPLIPGDEASNLTRTDFRQVGKDFNRAPSYKDWQKLYTFLNNLDEKNLGKFLKKRKPVENFNDVQRPPFFTDRIDKQDQPELHAYNRLEFSSKRLFSPAQIDLFVANLTRLKETVKRFLELPQKSPATILQLMLAMDPVWVRRFVIYKLFRTENGDLRKTLFADSEQLLTDIGRRKALKESNDKSSDFAGYSGEKMCLPKLSGAKLTETQLRECQEILLWSLTDEELMGVLNPNKKLEPPTQRETTKVGRPKSSFEGGIFEGPAPKRALNKTPEKNPSAAPRPRQ